MGSKIPFNFEEFYQAFGRSVSADVVFEDGQVRVVQRHKTPAFGGASVSKESDGRTDNAYVLPPIVGESEQQPQEQAQKKTKGRLLDSADRRRLPVPLGALLALQEPDGSWVFSNKFEFVLNGVAPPPVEGISGKLWATAVAIAVWRQFPEYFELLETHYEKAMLHADENVLRLVRPRLQFDALDKIRVYKSNEARAIREQLAREAAAKRELEFDKERKAAELREQEVRIGKLSLIHARRLPMNTQQLFVSELRTELSGVFAPSSPPKATDSKARQQARAPTFSVGELVECSRRRRTDGSATAVSTTPVRWYLCRIAAVDEESRMVQLDFLDGDRERERRVPMKFVRSTAAGALEARDADLATLKATWGEPIVCEVEVARLDGARAARRQPPLWDDRHHLDQRDYSQEKRETGMQGQTGRRLHLEASPQQEGTARSSAQSVTHRPRSSRALSPLATTRTRLENGTPSRDPTTPLGKLFQAAAVVLMAYDQSYARVCEAVEAGAKRYATAILYRQRFQAFDELADALAELMQRTVEALEAVWRWKKYGQSDDGAAAHGSSSRTFVWKGDDFVFTLVRSLDFLAGYPELVEWYGEEFPLALNPFLLSASLLDKAAQRGLQHQPFVHQHPNGPGRLTQLHRPQAKMLAKRTQTWREGEGEGDCAAPQPQPQGAVPTWWPETRYPPALRRRIEQAEEGILAELLAARWLIQEEEEAAT